MKKRRPPARPNQPPEGGRSRKYHSRAVEKALEIVEMLKNSPGSLSLHKLSLETRLTKVSLLRILATLESSGYIERTEQGHYQLTAALRSLRPARALSHLMLVSSPELKELTYAFRESSALAFLFDNHVEVVAVVESPQTIRMGNTVGRILQPHASSLGKCITAFQAEARRASLLRSYGMNSLTEKTIVDEGRLEEEFVRIRKAGYAVDDEETAPGGKCFGAPIAFPNGEVLAALSVSVPKSRLTTGIEKRLVDQIRRTTSRISAGLRTATS